MIKKKKVSKDNVVKFPSKLTDTEMLVSFVCRLIIDFRNFIFLIELFIESF